MTAADILSAAAAFADDPEQETYTNAVMLPYLARAYGVVERKLINVGSRKLRTTSPDITLNGQELNILNRTDGVLDDLLSPIELYRKEINSYIKMIDFSEYQVHFPKSYDIIDNYQLEDAIMWEWQKGKFRFSRVLNNEVVKVVYFSTLRPAGEVLSPDSNVFFPELVDCLAKYTAAYTATYRMEDPIRGSTLEQKAMEAWEDVEAFEVKERQTEGVRRKGFKNRNRRRF